jgi:translation initiation factor 2 subunit 1
MSLEELYKMIVWPLQTEEILAHDIFQRALLDYDKTISKLNLEPKIKEALKKELEKRYPLQQKKIKAEFHLNCYSANGIEDMKRALLEGESLKDDINQLKITLISSPRFIVNAMSYDPKKGVELVQNCLDRIKTAIKDITPDSEFEIKDEPKVLGYKDERELENMINEVNRQMEYDDEEDEYVEDMGTMDIDENKFRRG